MTASIELQLSLILFVAIAGYLIATRINQSAVVGAILAGLLLGPSLLGWITYTDQVKSFANIGAVVLLFVVGLEFKPKDILKFKYFVIALAGVLVPWAGGYFLARAFGFELGPSIFVGTALTATSIAITAQVLKEMGKLQTETARAIIGAAVIDDVLGLLALSISDEFMLGSFSLQGVSDVLARAVVFLIAMAIMGFMLGKLLDRINKSRTGMNYPEAVFLFALMVAFLFAVLAELIGLSAIIGAFMAGVALGGHKGHFLEGTEYMRVLFASIFFVSLGILINIRALLSPSVMWFLLALVIVAILTKVIGCGLAAKFQGINSKDSLVIGLGMSPRGEVAMIVALVGLNAGLIQQNVYSALVMMSLLTTIATPALLKHLMKKRKYSAARD